MQIEQITREKLVRSTSDWMCLYQLFILIHYFKNAEKNQINNGLLFANRFHCVESSNPQSSFFFFFFLAIPLAIELQMILFCEFSDLLQVFAITVRSKYMDVNQPAMPWKICITSNVFFAALVVSCKRLCFYL